MAPLGLVCLVRLQFRSQLGANMATVLTLPEGPLALELLKVRSRARVDRLCDDCAYAATLLIAGARTRWWWTHRHRPSCAHPRHRPRLLPSTPTPTPMSTTSVPILAWPPTVHQPLRATRWSVHRTARSGPVAVCRQKTAATLTTKPPGSVGAENGSRTAGFKRCATSMRCFRPLPQLPPPPRPLAHHQR